MSLYIVWLFLSVKSTVFWLVKSEIVCSGHYFNHSCPKGELLVIHSAEYGFLQNGTCNIWYDELNPHGCLNDMTYDVIRTCTGKTGCRYPPSENVPSGSMHKDNKHCLGSKSLREMYAEINYGCYPMIDPRADCTMSGSNVMIHVIPVSILKRNNCILKIVARKGQRIKIKITDNTRNEGLREYGIIFEPESQASQILAKGIQYHSLSFQYWINITKYNENDVFIIDYKVLGCPSEIALQENTIVIHQNSTMALIGCNTSPRDVTWALHCVNNTWQGMEKNCIRQQLNSRWPVTVALVSGGVLIMLAVLSVVTVCYFYRSRNSQQIVQSENQAMPPDLPISAQNSCRIEVPSPQCDNYFLGQLNNNISLMADPELVYPPPPRESYLAQLEAGYTKQDNDGSNDLEHSLTPPPTPPPSYPENAPPPPPTVAPPPPLDMASYTGEALYSVETEPGKCGQVINGMLQLEEPHYYDIN